jgi:hypothetical protein
MEHKLVVRESTTASKPLFFSGAVIRDILSNDIAASEQFKHYQTVQHSINFSFEPGRGISCVIEYGTDQIDRPIPTEPGKGGKNANEPYWRMGSG